MTIKPPKLFISYSWTSPINETWVLRLATELRENNVDVILDKWDLKEGQDLHVFMEKMVTDPDIKKVIIVCDHQYAEKANERNGGVGTETQIITPEIYSKQDQTKFVAVLPERNEKGEPYLPTFYKSRIFIDLSDPDLYSKNFEQLLRWIFDKPLHVKPVLGKSPAFLSEDSTISLSTSVVFRRSIIAIRENHPNCQGVLIEFFETFAKNLEQFRIIRDDEEFDEKVVKNIEQFLPYRDQVIEIVKLLTRYRPISESWKTLHQFFENLIPYLDRKDDMTQIYDSDFDNFKIIIHELFLYVIAILLQSECFEGVTILLHQYYYIPINRTSREPLYTFSILYQYPRSLENRLKRLDLKFESLHANILETRSKHSGISFQELMQADFILYIRDCFDSIRLGHGQHWWPVTWVYLDWYYGPFKVFVKCRSINYFNSFKQIFNIEEKKDFNLIINGIQEEKIRYPKKLWGGEMNPLQLIDFESIGILP